MRVDACGEEDVTKTAAGVRTIPLAHEPSSMWRQSDLGGIAPTIPPQGYYSPQPPMAQRFGTSTAAKSAPEAPSV
jgi:hypothetical protein